jgi:hypothetical protein
MTLDEIVREHAVRLDGKVVIECGDCMRCIEREVDSAGAEAMIHMVAALASADGWKNGKCNVCAGKVASIKGVP